MEPDILDPMVWSDYGLKMVIALVLSGIVGLERHFHRKPAGLRTHMLVCIGSLVFTLLGMDLFERSISTVVGVNPTRVDPLRIVEAIVGGLGFLGAGAIIQARGHVRGLTTATSMWTMGALGVAIGIGNYPVAILTTIMLWIVLQLIDRLDKRFRKKFDNRGGSEGSTEYSGSVLTPPNGPDAGPDDVA